MRPKRSEEQSQTVESGRILEGSGGGFHRAGIGLGSNLGNSLALLQTAWQRLHDQPEIFPLALSSPYRSQPVEMVSSHWFINAAGLVRTTLTPQGLLRELQTIETLCGRVRHPQGTGYQDRTLDLDLLFYDDLVFHSGDLVLPHPRMRERLFVLEPLAEITGDWIDPLSGKQVNELLLDLIRSNPHQVVERVRWPQ